MKSKLEDENRQLYQACTEVRGLLGGVAQQLREILEDEVIIRETPLEAHAVMETAVKAIGEALRRLDSVKSADKSAVPPRGSGPTRQQGQFLAFIREYILRNKAGAAPSHADFQRFFNLTPPSVNSMLIRLEQRGFIRREPGKARAIELVINSDWIPELDRLLKF